MFCFMKKIYGFTSDGWYKLKQKMHERHCRAFILLRVTHTHSPMRMTLSVSDSDKHTIGLKIGVAYSSQTHTTQHTHTWLWHNKTHSYLFIIFFFSCWKAHVQIIMPFVCFSCTTSHTRSTAIRVCSKAIHCSTSCMLSSLRDRIVCRVRCRVFAVGMWSLWSLSLPRPTGEHHVTGSMSTGVDGRQVAPAISTEIKEWKINDQPKWIKMFERFVRAYAIYQPDESTQQHKWRTRKVQIQRSGSNNSE